MILVGDPHQLGPILASPLVASYGLRLSLLERLMERPPYQRDETKFGNHGNYDPSEGAAGAIEEEKEKVEDEEMDLFKLVVVNSYGSQEVQKLKDDGKTLKLTSKYNRWALIGRVLNGL